MSYLKRRRKESFLNALVREKHIWKFLMLIVDLWTHQEDHKMKCLLFRQGLYWPTMLKDCIEFAKRCQECEKTCKHSTGSY